MHGSTVSHYRIDSTIGEGGMGVVYVATDLRLRRQVAIKFCGTRRPSVHDGRSLLAEARAASKLNHPNIAHIYDCDELPDGRPFVVMEYVRGKSLAHVLQERRLGVDEAVRLVRDVAAALHEAHSNGIVHRDIKPSNVCVTDAGKVKVLDFGIAKVMAPSPGEMEDDPTHTVLDLTIDGTVKGTPSYMAPEQAQCRPVDHRADLFSLGCVLFECLTGHRPFEGKTHVQTLSLVIGGKVPPPSTLNPDVPPYLDAAVAKLLMKRPEQRYQSARELISDLSQGHVKTVPATRTLTQTLTDFAHTVNQPKATVSITPLRIGLAVLAVLAGALGYYLANRPYQPSPQAQRSYEEGLAALRDGTYVTAQKRLQQAVDLDQDFAIARARLAEAWFELDYGSVASRELLRVRQASSGMRRMTTQDRLTVEAIENLITFRRKEAVEKYRELASMYDGLERAAAIVDLGRTQEAGSDTDAAIASFKEAIKADSASAAAWLRLGQIQYRKFEDNEAAKSLTEAERLYRSSAKPEGQAEAEFYLIRLRDPSRMESALTELARSAAQSGNAHLQIRVLIQLAGIAVRKGDFERADQYAQESVKVAEESRFEVLAARALLTMGQTFVGKRGAQAEQYFKQALMIARTHDSRLTEARASVALANFHQSRGMSRMSLEESSRGAKYFAEAGLPQDEADALLARARSLRSLGKLNEAERECEVLAGRQTSQPRQRAQGYECLAIVYSRQANFRKAIEAIRKGTDLSQGPQQRLNRAYAQLQLVQPYAELGEFDEAQRLVTEVIATARAMPSPALLNAAQQRRTLLDVYRNRPASALPASAALVRESSKTETPYDWVASAALHIMTQARSGMARQASAACPEVLTAAGQLEEVFSLPYAEEACAEALLKSGDKAGARSIASKAATFYESLGMRQDHWRMLALLAGAGDSGAAAKAKSVRDELLANWQPGDAASYLSRPDIRLFSAYAGI